MVLKSLLPPEKPRKIGVAVGVELEGL